MENIEFKTITKERYKELLEAETILQALRTAGVDNWEGYDDTMEFLEKLKEKGIRLKDMGWNPNKRKVGYAKTKGVGDGYSINFHYFDVSEGNVLITCPRGFTNLRGYKISDMDNLIKLLSKEGDLNK